MNASVRIVLSTVFILVMSSLAIAQSAVTGAVTGSVSDPSNAVIPNATVTLRSMGTNREETVSTGTEGRFRFGNLQPGTYSLSIKALASRNTSRNP